MLGRAAAEVKEAGQLGGMSMYWTHAHLDVTRICVHIASVKQGNVGDLLAWADRDD